MKLLHLICCIVALWLSLSVATLTFYGGDEGRSARLFYVGCRAECSDQYDVLEEFLDSVQCLSSPDCTLFAVKWTCLSQRESQSRSRPHDGSILLISVPKQQQKKQRKQQQNQPQQQQNQQQQNQQQQNQQEVPASKVRRSTEERGATWLDEIQMLMYSPTEDECIELPGNKLPSTTTTPPPPLPPRASLVVHGFGIELDEVRWPCRVARALHFADPQQHVFLVDWSAGRVDVAAMLSDAVLLNPLDSVRTAKEEIPGAADSVVAFVRDNLVRRGLNLTSGLHCVGHSLGAHLCGFVGKAALRDGLGPMAMITALDPAGTFLFSGLPPDERLDRSDAALVRVLHTDTSANYWRGDFLALGLDEAIGHVDIYANGGDDQPGCWGTMCDHSRAYLYFLHANLLRPCFARLPCGTRQRARQADGSKCVECQRDWSCVQLSNRSLRKHFFIKTTGQAPYCTSLVVKPWGSG